MFALGHRRAGRYAKASRTISLLRPCTSKFARTLCFLLIMAPELAKGSSTGSSEQRLLAGAEFLQRSVGSSCLESLTSDLAVVVRDLDPR